MTSRRLAEWERTEMHKMLHERVPYREIAEAFSVSISSVHYHAVRVGLGSRQLAAPLTPPPEITPIDGYPDLPSAACYDGDDDPEIFFPAPGHANVEDPLVQQAIDICRRCDVREACLQWALNHDEHGIWGGLTERERRKLERGAVA